MEKSNDNSSLIDISNQNDVENIINFPFVKSYSGPMYRFGDMIGRGSYGAVHLAYQCDDQGSALNSEKLVIKFIDMRNGAVKLE
jgi:hypothetical protein